MVRLIEILLLLRGLWRRYLLLFIYLSQVLLVKLVTLALVQAEKLLCAVKEELANGGRASSLRHDSYLFRLRVDDLLLGYSDTPMALNQVA